MQRLSQLRRLAPIVLLAAASAPVSAEGLRPDRVPAEARWLVHFDVERFVASEFWGVLRELAEVEGVADLDDAMGDLRDELGIDPLADVRAVTLFGSDLAEEQVVVLAVVRGGVGAAIERLEREGEVRRTRREGLEILSFGDGDGFGHVRPVRGSDDQLVLMAGDAAGLVRSARVLDREAPSLSGEANPALRRRPSKGSILYVSASEGLPGTADFEPAAQLTELVQALEFDLGESRGELQVHVGLIARTAEDARSISDVIEGLLALARLGVGQALEGSSLRYLLDEFDVATNGGEVRIDFQYDVAALLAELTESIHELENADW